MKSLREKRARNILIFSVSAVGAGLFPFILLPFHLSPHYMNISVLGMTIAVSFAVLRVKSQLAFLMIGIFMIVAFYNIRLIINNNWVIKRSQTAFTYIQKAERENLPSGSTMVFDDNSLSSSQEAYVVLGGGEAIKFWFPEKNYQTCFTAFEKCDALP